MTDNTHVNGSQTIDSQPSDVLGPEVTTEIVNPLPDPVKEVQDNVDPGVTTDVEFKELGDKPSNLDNDIADVAGKYLGFDPEIHASKTDGSPVYRADGVTYAKKRGKKPAGFIRDPLPPSDQQNPQSGAQPVSSATSQPQPAVDYTAVGKMYAAMFFGATNSMIGSEWMPNGVDEKKAVENAFGNWAKSQEMTDLPPGWALVVTLGFYSMARFQHENTQSKFSKLKEKLAHVILWAKHRMGK